MFTAKVIRAKGKHLDRLQREVRGQPVVWAGWVNAPADIVERAVINEFGSTGDHVPERPALRNAIRGNLAKYVTMLKDGAHAIYRGTSTPESVLDGLGKTAAEDIRQEIMALQSPPNAPATIKRKGSSKPLVETGAMTGALGHEVKA